MDDDGPMTVGVWRRWWNYVPNWAWDAWFRREGRRQTLDWVERLIQGDTTGESQYLLRLTLNHANSLTTADRAKVIAVWREVLRIEDFRPKPGASETARPCGPGGSC